MNFPNKIKMKRLIIILITTGLISCDNNKDKENNPVSNFQKQII